MIEIIAVLTMIGLLTAAVVSRYDRSTELIVAANVVRTHMRYAQNQAMNRDQSWRVTKTATTYTLNTPTGTALFPGENDPALTLSPDITFTDGVGTVCFDKWGAPFTTTVIVDGITNCDGGTVTIDLVLSLNAATQTIAITKETGFIP